MPKTSPPIPGASKIFMVYSGDLDSVVDDDPKVIKQESLLEKGDYPVADDLLVALRRILSMTYTDRLELEDLRKSFAEIRQLLVAALRPLGDLLKLVKSSPVGA